MEREAYPINQIREQFPALQRIEHDHFVAYFDGPGGTQVAKTVIESMAAYMKNGVANLGGTSPTSKETATIVEEARSHVAVLLGTEKTNIAFGANMTTLSFRIARTLASQWQMRSGNIVVTEIDHHANVDPWKTAAEAAQMDVHTIPLDSETKTLDLRNLNNIINEETKLVALGLASNAIGTINDYVSIMKRAKEVGALIALDAVHAVPHFSINFDELDADFLFCSVYKFFGPHVGIVAIKPEVFQRLQPFKLQPAPDEAPMKLETGTINFEGLVGVIAAIQFMADIGDGNLLREQLISAYEKMEGYEHFLAERLRKGLAAYKQVTLYQADATIRKTPTVAFHIRGKHPKAVCEFLVDKYALHLEYGDFYAKTLVEKITEHEGGLIRAGIAPYNTIEEIDRLIEAVATLCK